MLVGVVANIEDPEAGIVEERLEEIGATFARRWRSDPETLDGFERSVDLLVHLGSDWSVYDPAYRREIDAERGLVRRAAAYGCPVLGICFGGQLVASSLGLDIVRASPGEIGWVEVASSEPALVPAGRWFQYHLDQWVSAPDHPSIAASDAAPQAVRLGRTLGVQFHPEVTDDVITRWVDHGASDLAALGIDPATVLADTARWADDAEQQCRALVDRFLVLGDSAIARSQAAPLEA